MEETIVSFKVAKLAKEKGFKIPSHSYYFEDGEFKEVELIETHGYYGDEFTVSRSEFFENWNDAWKTTKSGDRCFGCDKRPAYLETFSAPTQSLLQKWFRDAHNIDIDITRCNAQNHNDGVGYQYECITPVIESISDFKIYGNYEEALEKGLQEALGLL